MQLTSNFAERNAIVSGKVNEKYGLRDRQISGISDASTLLGQNSAVMQCSSSTHEVASRFSKF